MIGRDVHLSISQIQLPAFSTSVLMYPDLVHSAVSSSVCVASMSDDNDNNLAPLAN